MTWQTLVVAGLVFIGACGGPLQSPSSVETQGETEAGVRSPQVEPVPVPGLAVEVQGPSGCVRTPSGDLVWRVPGRAEDLILMVHHDATPGCAATTANPRRPGMLTWGQASDSVLVTYPRNGWASWERQACGRVQVDLASRATGRLYVGMVVDYETACAPPPPPPPPPPCESIHAPSFGALFPVGGYGARATVANAGAWTLTLYAGPQPGKAEFVKAVDAVTLACGQTANLAVDYPRAGHPSPWWWADLRLNGAVVWTSTYAP